jgi:acid phosphatase
VRQEWVPLFERHGIALVLSGHDHNYERLRRDGLTYVVSGGGSSVLYRMRDRLPESESFAARTHFVLLDLHQDRIELQAVALGGELLDRATISVEGR